MKRALRSQVFNNCYTDPAYRQRFLGDLAKAGALGVVHTHTDGSKVSRPLVLTEKNRLRNLHLTSQTYQWDMKDFDQRLNFLKQGDLRRNPREKIRELGSILGLDSEEVEAEIKKALQQGFDQLCKWLGSTEVAPHRKSSIVNEALKIAEELKMDRERVTRELLTSIEQLPKENTGAAYLITYVNSLVGESTSEALSGKRPQNSFDPSKE